MDGLSHIDESKSVGNNEHFHCIIKSTIALILKVPKQTQIANFNATGHSITFKMIVGVNVFSLLQRAEDTSRDVYRKLQKIQMGICC